MAMARSLAPLLLLSVLVSGAAAARTVGDSVQDACSKSQFPKVCADGLSAKPEAQKATPRGLAELFVGFAAEKGSWMATFLHGKFNSGKDSTMLDCYDSCGEDIEEAMAHLNGLIREPTDAKLLELKSWLSSTVGSGTSACEEACKDAPKTSDKDDVVNKSFEFEKLLRVTLDLITEASGSMSADIALPPSDAAAPSSYGAAAPSGGSSAEAPATSEGPSTGGASGASGPSADSPAAGADAPSGASSSAPSPSGSSAADAPSGDSDAPAPSSDASADDDNDDDDDDTKA
ncbi:hypothetical protein SETIT_2G096500v2 [Setaria italica]|uniref:Pectinesterase inhibitor domain-containing protein n=1 Tax=Setaria italica TaxID=4555 RepID=A0A368PXR5_SETIT|nr:uncharacterized protein DDB_G0284671 [Setaria italica]RCV10238.1 hypothetical protein SETIT_2G096500v2 [Setaria italica]